MPTCRRCQTAKEDADFGSGGICKKCLKDKNKSSYEKNKTKRLEAAKSYRDSHKEQIAETNKSYRDSHKEQLNKYRREWGKSNKVIRSEGYNEHHRLKERERYHSTPAVKEKQKAQAKQWRQLNKSKYNERQKIWQRTHRERVRELSRAWWAKMPIEDRQVYLANSRAKHKVKRKLYNTEYRCKRDGSEGNFSNDYLNCLHHWQDHSCFYCRNSFNKDDQIEHIVPISKSGTNYPYNIVLACGKCNSSKQDKLYFIEWLPTASFPTNKIHSIWATSDAKKHFNQLGIATTEKQFPYLLINGITEVLFISSFWCETLWPVRLNNPETVLIYDHEWFSHKEAITNFLLAKCLITKPIGARELKVATPTLVEAKEFLDKWHIQGFNGGSLYIGLSNESSWKAIASVTEYQTHFNLTRLAFHGRVMGGTSRLISSIIKIIGNTKPLISYCDLRFGEGSSYIKSGFTHVEDTKESYYYANGVGIFNRLSYTKREMSKKLDFYSEEFSEAELAKANGLLRLDGLPQRKFILGK